MKTQLQQLFFISLFSFFCTVFVFFVPWWSSDDNEVEDIEQVENISENQWDNIEQEAPRFSWTLRIAIKEWMQNKELKDFVDNFKSIHGWEVEFTEIDSPSNWNWLEWFDLYLFPYDQLTGVQFWAINFQEDISSLFIPQLKDFVVNHKNIIPFWIDVPVVYWINDISEWIDGLVEASQNWKPARPVWAFNFWISDNEATYDNSLIASHQIADFIAVNDIWAFSQWINFSTSSQESQKWLLYSVQWNSDLCKERPLPCLLEKNLLWVAWGFNSDYNQDYDWVLVAKKYPYEWVSQFVRLYALALGWETENSTMALQFILDYMDYAFIENSSSIAKSLWLVPVFQNEYTQNCYQDACWIESNISILEDGFSLIKRFYNDSVFRKVVWKKIQPNLYLVNTLV